MRSSIKEVAGKANVSAMTVSRVLNGDAKVSANTRERILQAIRELDYVPVSQPGTQRRNKQTHTIGLVFDQLDEVRDYVGFESYVGLRDGARQFGYDLLILVRETPSWAQGREEVLFLDRRTDGIVFVNPFQRYGLMEKLVQENIPMVSCGFDNPPGVASVVFDDFAGIVALMEHLYEQGHRKIGFVAGPEALGADYRKQGFVRATEALGLRNQKFIFPGTGPNSWHSDRVALDKALVTARKEGLTALMCANDYLAGALIKRASSQGLHVPRELAVTGVDDVPLADQRGITTVHNDFAERGRMAIEILVDLLQGRSATEASRVLPTSVVIRKSSGKSLKGEQLVESKP